MKPITAGEIILTKEIHDVCREVLEANEIDEIGQGYIVRGYPFIFSALRAIQAPVGFAWTGSFSRPLGVDHLIYGCMSVLPHEDYGFGITALTLLYCEDFEAVLFTGGTYVVVREGDIVLFDSQQSHAWMSNGKWVLAAMPAKRVRRDAPPAKNAAATAKPTSAVTTGALPTA